MLLVFTAATFLGAALLFAIQPFAARQALPVFGGTPAVWNTAVMFFQTSLLAGYIYAHLLTTKLAFRAQFVVHALVLIAAVAVPVGLQSERLASLDSSPGVWQLLGLLLTGVGLPFFAVSSAGPLIQRWFGATAHRSASDPYFLYAASNAGSFLGLLTYPFAIEPTLSLPEQATAWRLGFVAFAALLLACGLCVWLRARNEPPVVVTPDTTPARQRWRQRTGWMFFAFVPSSLMIGVTQYLSTDIAAVPLLWIVPLGLYLLTFVAAFSRAGDRVATVTRRLWPFAVVTVVLAFLLDARQPLEVIVLLHLFLLVAAGCLCHGRLRASRPGVARLTEFYLCLSIGGALAGVFHTFLAPALFNDLHEYPLAIVLACVAMPAAAKPMTRWQRLWWLAPPALLLGLVLAPHSFTIRPDGSRSPMLLLTAGLPAFVLFLAASRPRVFLWTTGGVLLAVIVRGDGSHVELRERTFFGMHTVRNDGRFRVLGHGTTIHGMESLDPAHKGEPLAYYHRRGPVGNIFSILSDRFERVGLIGLGAGSMASYSRDGQTFDFFEIDPTVVRIAQDPAYFSFLTDALATIRVVLGDGRLAIAREPDASYDCIVLDAFSSDSVPVHLLTREAVELYASKLRPGGVLLFHLSNRHLDLGPFAAAAAESVGMACIERQDDRTLEQTAESGRQGSRWMLASANPEVLEAFDRDVRWMPSRTAPRPWTDARADIVAALLSDSHEVYTSPSRETGSRD